MDGQTPGSAELLLTRVRDVIGDGRAGLHEPTLEGNAAAYVADTVTSGWVSSVGSYVDRFEEMLSTLTGAHAVACVNGTSALQLALRMSGVEAGDLVLMPSLTFVASANAVRHIGADPHFVDVDEQDLGLSADLVRATLQRDYERGEGGTWVHAGTGQRLAAIMLVHVFGNPADAKSLRVVADDFGLPLVEDAAEALAAWDEDDVHCGTRGSVGVLSFNGNKLVTTGGGGAILTRDADMAARAKKLTTTAKEPHPWEYRHNETAWNYRMPNLNAALGCAQLEELDGLLDRKAKLAQAYEEALTGVGGVEVIRARVGTRPNNWLVAVRLDSRARQQEFLALSNDAGVQTRPLWVPMHQLPMFETSPRGPLPVTESLASTIVNLPSSAHLWRG